MLLHEKMVSANPETISNKIFFCFFTVYLTGGTSNMCPGGFYASFYAQNVATCCAAGSAGSTVSAVRIGPTPL